MGTLRNPERSNANPTLVEAEPWASGWVGAVQDKAMMGGELSTGSTLHGSSRALPCHI